MEDLPSKIEDITAAWLSQALALRYPGTEVTSCHLGTVIAGTGTKVRLLLGYNDAGHRHRLPPTMWLKGAFIRHNHTYDIAIAAEAGFYGQWAETLPVNIPRCYFAGCNAQGTRGVVLLEDLLARNASFGYAPRPLSLEQQAQTLDLLAAVHGRWWRSPGLAPLTHYSTRRADSDGVMMRMLERDYFASCLAHARGEAVSGAYRDPEKILRALRNLWGGSVGLPETFLHGDAHLGNMFFERDGRPGFLDWQAYQRGPHMHDVTYSIIGNLTVQDRRAAERDLLRYYLDRLRHHGVEDPPSFAETWEGYRRNVLHGFLWFCCPIEMQPEEIILAEATRFGPAVTDLDTFGALGVA